MARQVVGGDIVLYVKRGVGPTYGFQYEGCAEHDDTDLAPGDITAITCKSNTAFRETVNIDIAIGEAGLPSSAIRVLLRQAQWLMQQSGVCQMTLDFRFGLCGQPDNPDDWSEILRFNDAYIQTSGVNTGAGATDKVLVSANVSGLSYDMLYSITSDIVDVGSYGGLDCVLTVAKGICSGDCGPGFELCDYVFVATEGEYLSTSEIIYTDDGGSTWTAMAVSPFAAGESVSFMVGDVGGDATGTTMRLIVFRGTTDAGNAAECSITTDWGATWSAVDIGSVNGQYVTAAFRRGRKIWVGCDDGDVYYSADGGNTWDRQSTGVITNQINSINMQSDSVGILVADSDEGLYTTDGATWSALGDVVGGSDPNLTAVWMTSQWIAYVATATGYVYYSVDRGTTWTQLQNIGAGITDIQFASATVGYLLADAKLWRTVDGVTFTEQTSSQGAILRDLDLCSVNRGWAVGQTSGNLDLAVHFQPIAASSIS